MLAAVVVAVTGGVGSAAAAAAYRSRHSCSARSAWLARLACDGECVWWCRPVDLDFGLQMELPRTRDVAVELDVERAWPWAFFAGLLRPLPLPCPSPSFDLTGLERPVVPEDSKAVAADSVVDAPDSGFMWSGW